MTSETSWDNILRTWSSEITQDSTWKLIDAPSWELHPGSTENSLLAGTLRTPEAVRGIKAHVRRELKQFQSKNGTQVCILFALGSGVHGIAGVCHGGLISLMIDEVTGQLAAEAVGRYNIITASLCVVYKRKLETPAVVLCRAWLPASTSGRKLTISGTVEDRQGVVYAQGEAVFVNLKSTL